MSPGGRTWALLSKDFTPVLFLITQYCLNTGSIFIKGE
jgi:hypothetical protein